MCVNVKLSCTVYVYVYSKFVTRQKHLKSRAVIIKYLAMYVPFSGILRDPLSLVGFCIVNGKFLTWLLTKTPSFSRVTLKSVFKFLPFEWRITETLNRGGYIKFSSTALRSSTLEYVLKSKSLTFIWKYCNHKNDKDILASYIILLNT